MPRVRARSTSVSSSTAPISPCPATVQTAAERGRERKLRDDPMAIVVNPMYVDCKRCGSRIKLSSKSPYDTFHWRTHRTRCLKKQHGTVKVRKMKNTLFSPTRDSITSPSNEPQKRYEKISKSEPQNSACKGTRDLEIIDDESHSANLNLLTSVANAVLKRSGNLSCSPEELAKSYSRQWRGSQRNTSECHGSDSGWRGTHEGMDELRMRQEAIESLALLSRSG